MTAINAKEHRHHWLLDPAWTFLNHGSFGACPIPVLEEQARLRERLERQPVRFMARELEGLLDDARKELARFVGADPEGLAFVPNATTGVNTFLRCFPLRPGDEVLVTNHEYNASRNALDAVAEASGATVVLAPVPWPVQSADQIVEAVLSKVTPRTRLFLVDHVTSQTALVMPLERLVRALKERGVETLVDGAHAPGMVPLDLDSLGAAAFTGNCHKWICAPKGAAFLWVREDWRDRVHPLVVSHGRNRVRPGRSRFRLEFDWPGTQDFSSFLCIPVALRFLGGLLPGGWNELREHNRTLALAARQRLAKRLGTALPCPDELVGSMACVLLPERQQQGAWSSPLDIDPLQDSLFHEERIEVPIIPFPRPPHRHVPISAQLYNEMAEYDRLGEALAARPSL